MSYRRGTRRKHTDWKGLAEIAFITIVGTVLLLALVTS